MEAPVDNDRYVAHAKLPKQASWAFHDDAV